MASANEDEGIGRMPEESNRVIVDMTVPSAEASVPLVRRAVRDAARAADGINADALQDLVLVVSELAGNAVMHAGDVSRVIRARCLVQSGHWRVELHDASPVLPRLRRCLEDGDVRGRGLQIVERLSLSWGAAASPRGKSVWACVPVRGHSSDGDGQSSQVIASARSGRTTPARIGSVPGGPAMATIEERA
jgi:anti-sigma regulatory factor (Ser/Thr protein kinase)